MKWERAEKMFAHSGLSLTEGQFHQFSTYQEILVETNRRMNLTTITEDAEVWRKHFLDSCLPFQYVEIPKGAAVIDVGTGAGFPGIPMRILRPDLRLTMLDSLQKRVDFLRDCCNENLCKTAVKADKRVVKASGNRRQNSAEAGVSHTVHGRGTGHEPFAGHS